MSSTGTPTLDVGGSGPTTSTPTTAATGAAAPPPSSSASNADSSRKVIYYLDDEATPYLVKVCPASAELGVTLGDLKAALNRPQYKYFFKAEDKDFGVVKEEIFGDATPLPLYNNSIVCWLELAGTTGSVVSTSSTNASERSKKNKSSKKSKQGETTTTEEEESEVMTLPPPGAERGPGVGETRPPSFHGGNVDSPSEIDHTDDTESLLSRQQQHPPKVSKSKHQQRHHHHSRMPRFGEELDDDEVETFDDDESAITSVSAAAERRRREMRARMNNGSGRRQQMQRHHEYHESSELESSLYDSEDVGSMASSRMTTSTEHTSVSQQHMVHRQKRRSKRRAPQHMINRAGSISSITDSTMSMNCITVTLNLDTVNFLGISIVGHSNTVGNEDWGIYVGSIMKGGAVALDGRIEPGDMLLEVNEVSFEDMSNDDAVKVLREIVKKPGPVKLVVAKRWPQEGTTTATSSGVPSGSGKGNFLSMPRQEPVRPIDPGAWVAHTAAVRGAQSPPLPPESFINFGQADEELDALGDQRYGDLVGLGGPAAPPLSHFGPHVTQGDYLGRHPSVTTLSGSSIISSQAETEKYFPAGAPGLAPNPHLQHSLPRGYPGGAVAAAAPAPTFDPSSVQLSTTSDMATVVRCMRAPNSGLEVKERVWLKIKISNAFIGTEVVDWLFDRLQGFSNRRDARKYAAQLLKDGYIKHSVQKTTFSEECYYTFAEKDLQQSMAGMGLHEAPTGPAPPVPQQQQQQWVPQAPQQQQQQPAPQMVVPLPAWTPGSEQWMPPESTNTTTTTYGPIVGGASIYNPAAPPPSSNYGIGGAYGVQQPRSSGGSGSGHSVQLLQLAGSGSGSESDGRPGSTVGSASETGGFRQRQEQQQQHGPLSSYNAASQPSMGPPAYQAC